jgi:dCMP deaminase
MPNKIDYVHMKVAEAYSELSHARRLKVGAIVTKDDRVISIGYNGTPAGWDNNCEIEVRNEFEYYVDNGGEKYNGATIELVTKNEVIHAEANAIGKLARSSESGEGATMYITHAPCFACAKMIHIAGINKVLYRNEYRDTEGIEFLNKCNIEVEQI